MLKSYWNSKMKRTFLEGILQRKLVNNLKSTVTNLSPIETAYRIVHVQTTDEICRTQMDNAQKCFEKMLVKEHKSDSKSKSKKILQIWFTLLNTIEQKFGMTLCETGWDDSFIILLKSTSGYKRKYGEKGYVALKESIRSCYKEMFTSNGKENQVLVVIQDLKPTGTHYFVLS